MAEFNDAKPFWLPNLRFTPSLPEVPDELNWYGKYIKESEKFLQKEKDKLNESLAKKNEVYADGAALYSQFISGVDSIETGIKTVVDDFQQLGAKFTVLRPFSGYYADLRHQILKAMSPVSANYPRMGDDATAGSLTLLFSADEYSVGIIKFAQALFTFFGAGGVENSKGSWMTDMAEFLSNPTGGPIGKFITDDILSRSDSSINRMKASVTGIVDIGANMVANVKEASDKAQEKLKDTYENSPLANLSKVDFNTWTAGDNPLKTLFGDDVGDGIRRRALPAGTITIQSGAIEKGGIYELRVYEQGNIFEVEYDGAIYRETNRFVGKDATTFQIIAGSTNTGYLAQVDNPSVFNYSGIVTTDLSGIGPDSALTSSTIFTSAETRLNLALQNKYDLSRMFGRWYNLASIEDIAGGQLNGILNDIKDATENVGGFIKGAGSQVMTAVSWANSLIDAGATAQLGVYNKALEFLDALPKSLDSLGVDVFIDPPSVGGLDSVRFAHNEYFRPEAENAPNFDKLHLFLPVIIVFNDGGVISKFLEVLAPKET